MDGVCKKCGNESAYIVAGTEKGYEVCPDCFGVLAAIWSRLPVDETVRKYRELKAIVADAFFVSVET